MRPDLSPPPAGDWFVPLSDRGSAGDDLYAFPHAGGGCATFAGLAEALAPDIRLWALNLPGRQARFREPPRTELSTLIDELAVELAGRDRPVLLGYCSGALVAFLLARRMRRLGLPGPAGLVLVSYPSPDRAVPPRRLHEMESEQFWAEILSYGGVPAKVAAQPDFRVIFERALRADYALLSGYEYLPEPPLPIPVTVIHGRADPVLLPADVSQWRSHTSAAFRTLDVPGDHWLLDGDLDTLSWAVDRAVRPDSAEHGSEASR